MRITSEATFFDRLTDRAEIEAADADLAEIKSIIPTIHWPPGSGSFIINPTKEGNGVVPIKLAFAAGLEVTGWRREVSPFGRGGPGDFDAGRQRNGGWSTFVEWETGNISSSHRSLNRLTMALMRGLSRQGILCLADRELYIYLTDRIGNWAELGLYREVYERADVPGRLMAIVVGYDGTSPSVPLIGKMTDGRALR